MGGTVTEFNQLRQHFGAMSPEDQMQGWDELWQKDFKPWDRSQPNPALVETVEKKPNLFASPLQGKGGARKKALVPGCGGGYDPLLFASLGFDASGLDTSETAVKQAKRVTEDHNNEQQYPVRNVENGRGDVKFIVADFFKDEWLSQTHPPASTSERTFDIIYDHTFLCALDPSLRPRWAKRMSQLLSPNGRLICAEYPLGKPACSGGPPHGLERALYDQLFARPGEEVKYDEDGKVVEDRGDEKSDAALVKVDEWVPTRYFDTMQGKIWISVWGHR